MKTIYEDLNLIVFNKPTGVPSVPHTREETQKTAVGLALIACPDLLNVQGRRPLEPGLVHRLDTGTSGVLVFAKTQVMFERLTRLWKKKQIQKQYRALIQTPHPLPQAPQLIQIPLGHLLKSKKKMIALSPQNLKKIRGKPLEAITHLLSLHRIQPGEQGTLVDAEIRIETGVMHQIRCHLSTLGLPILGDLLYKGAPSERLWLHAWKIGIPLKKDHLLWIEAPLPEGWPQSLGRMTQPPSFL